MSHLRPEDRSSKRSRAACRKGRHDYGDGQNIGAGIVRQVCQTCGEVTIDLTGAEELAQPVIKSTGKIGTLRSGR
ncbi:MAG TPA: hypothetical protein VFO17_09920 [Acidimicrobiia bacterium]|nr:hypothetical protein [Acidimicrobiia bacterium]